ncbi:MAG: hypothetical protein ACYC35_15240 [Pirellulales bacterium]
MVEPFLIAETPRAGKWNHRFVVPLGKNVEQSEASCWCDLAAREPEGEQHLAAVRDVPQETTGRVGKEILVLANVPVRALSGAARKKVKDRLQDLLQSRLERLVTREMDWDRVGETLIVERAELAEWHRDEIAPLLAGRAARQREKTAPLLPEKGITKNRPPNRGRLTLVVWPIILAVVLIVACGLAIPSCKTLFSRLKSPASPTDQPDGPSINDSQLKLWCQLLGEPVRATAEREKVYGWMNKKLREDLVIEDEKARDESSGKTPRDELRDVLGALYQLSLSKEYNPGDLESLLQEQGIFTPIEKLYPAASKEVSGKPSDGAKTLNLFGWLESQSKKEAETERLRQLKEACPGGTKKDVQALRSLIGKAGEVANLANRLGDFSVGKGDYTLRLFKNAKSYKFPKAKSFVATSQTGPGMKKGKVRLAVLVEVDAEAVNDLVKWLSSTEANGLYSERLGRDREVHAPTIRGVLTAAIEALLGGQGKAGDDRVKDYIDDAGDLVDLAESRRLDPGCRACHAFADFLLEAKRYLDATPKSSQEEAGNE